jgi:succinate dehydrogenase / fumarate reductase cytochrome b subunit
MTNFFTSSIGKKIMMAGLGLFLIVFLLVHLGINLLLIISEDRNAFNVAAHFMATNIVIKIFEVVLFGGIILHVFYGFFVQIQNWIARPIGYKRNNNSETSFFSKFMIHTAVIIFVFLVIHLLDFYLKSKLFHGAEEVIINGKKYEDLGNLVVMKFQIPEFVIFYIACFLILGFHLLHGFQSAFQTLGLNHKTYTPIVKMLGVIYSILVVTGFITIPLVIYFNSSNI